VPNGCGDGAICVGGKAAVLSQQIVPINTACFRHAALTIDLLTILNSGRQTCIFGKTSKSAL